MGRVTVATPVHHKREVRHKRLLPKACERLGLLLGQRAVKQGVSFGDYFRRYGLSAEALENLRQLYPEKFEAWFGSASAEEALTKLARALSAEPVWVPKFIHVYERLRQCYPNFSWRIEAERRQVVFKNYPCDAAGRRPTLYDLVTGWTQLDPDYKDPIRRRRRTRIETLQVPVSGHIEQIRVRCFD